MNWCVEWLTHGKDWVGVTIHNSSTVEMLTLEEGLEVIRDWREDDRKLKHPMLTYRLHNLETGQTIIP